MGGMGEVFFGKLTGAEGFEKEVAIKKILPHLNSDRDFVAMLVHEAKLTVTLNHPNIVQIYDFGCIQGEYYIAMEYVHGATLSHTLESLRRHQEQLPIHVAVYITLQILHGLAYAHSAPAHDGSLTSVVHRDITPHNILLAEHGVAKITDFGIARALNEASTTITGMIKGKLGYLAPEQLEGGEPDARVDLFCAGIVLWEMLSLRRLFKGSSEMATFHLISQCIIPDLRDYRRDVPERLHDILRCALAREPKARFATAQQFISALLAAMPNTRVDDLALATRHFFAQHPGLLQAPPPLPNYDGVGHLLPPLPGSQNSAALPSVVSVLEPRKSRLRQGLIAVSMATLAASLVALAWLGRTPSLTAPSAPPMHPVVHEGVAIPTATDLQSSVQRAVAALSDPLAECYKRRDSLFAPHTSPKVTLVIAPSGAVTAMIFDVQVIRQARVHACMRAVLAQLKFPGLGDRKLEVVVALPAPPDSLYAATPKKSPPHAHGIVGRPLTDEEITATLERYTTNINHCFDGVTSGKLPRSLAAQLSIDSDGRVQTVRLNPGIKAPRVQSCLERNLRQVRFPEDAAQNFQVTVPLKI